MSAKMTPAERRAALQLEFERLKQRADRIDLQLQGDPAAWLEVHTVLQEGTHIAVVELDRAVAEGRQTALAMATVAKALAVLGEDDEKPADVDPLARLEKERSENVIPIRKSS